MSIEEIALQMAQSHLLNQNEDLKNYRNQASFCAAILGLIGAVFATLIGGENLANAHLRPCFLGVSLEVLFVLVTFLGGIVFSVRVIAGWATFEVHLNPIFLLENKKKMKKSAMFVAMTKDAEKYFDNNEAVLKDARSNLLFGLVCALLNFVAWSYLFLKVS